MKTGKAEIICTGSELLEGKLNLYVPLFHERLAPLVGVFYAPPFVDMHNRMKEALVLLGKLRCPAVRPPLVKLSREEIQRIKDALIAAGLLTQDGRARLAA